MGNGKYTHSCHHQSMHGQIDGWTRIRTPVLTLVVPRVYAGADARGTAGVAEYYRMPGYGLTLPLAFRKHQRRSLEPLLLRPVLQ